MKTLILATLLTFSAVKGWADKPTWEINESTQTNDRLDIAVLPEVKGWAASYEPSIDYGDKTIYRFYQKSSSDSFRVYSTTEPFEDSEIIINDDTPSALWHWETITDTDCHFDYESAVLAVNPAIIRWINSKHDTCIPSKQIKVLNKITGWHCVEWSNIYPREYRFNPQTGYLENYAELLDDRKCLREEGYREDGVMVFRKLKE